jgi:hypothetical protein
VSSRSPPVSAVRADARIDVGGRAYGKALQALRPFRREHHAQDSTDGLADVMHSIELKGVEKAFHVVDQFVD